jgi:paraquat-inducible protein B
MPEIGEGITNLMTSLDRVANTPDLTNSLAELRATLEQYRLLAEKVNAQVDPLAESATHTLARASEALVEIRTSVVGLGELLAPDSPLRNDLTIALEQLAKASDSISGLADFLQHHPNALITGRSSRPQKP